MRLDELVQTSAAVAETSGRLAKIATLAAFLRRLAPDEVPIAIGFLIGWPRQARLGRGWASVSSARGEPAPEASLELRDIDAAFDRLVSTRGKNSGAGRARLLEELMSRATPGEQQFLGALVIGEVRQGALEGVLLEAIAKGADVPADRVRRAVMMAGDLGAVAGAVLGPVGAAALDVYQLELFRHVQPMLADSAATVVDAFSTSSPVVVEWKLDGAR